MQYKVFTLRYFGDLKAGLTNSNQDKLEELLNQGWEILQSYSPHGIPGDQKLDICFSLIFIQVFILGKADARQAAESVLPFPQGLTG